MNEEELLKILEDCRDEYDKVERELPFGLSWYEYREALRPFRKKISEASRNYRKNKTPQFIGDVADYGDVMSVKHFISCCRSGGFIDSDGFGIYVKDLRETDIEIYPSDIEFNAVRDDFTEIVWFNK